MTEQEEMALRYLAANPHCVGKVQDELGPMSLWSANGLQQALEKAKAEERERIANQIDRMPFGDTAASFAVWIREGAP